MSNDLTSPSYEELSATWWEIRGILTEQEYSQEWTNYVMNKIFIELLKQCGWTIEKWNDETDRRKKQKEKKDVGSHK